MTKTPKKQEIELETDAWQRFERAVDVVSKSAPKHRVAKKKLRTKKTKPRRD